MKVAPEREGKRKTEHMGVGREREIQTAHRAWSKTKIRPDKTGSPAREEPQR